MHFDGSTTERKKKKGNGSEIGLRVGRGVWSERRLLTRAMAAFCARIVGFGRVVLGAGGGRAAVCGEAASGIKGVWELGMTIGGGSRRGDLGSATVWGWGWGELRDDHADIIARRRHEYDRQVGRRIL